mgnify:FL=1
MKSAYFSEETKQKIFQIVQAVFRVTNLFPYGEALRFELRKEASEVLKESARYSVISIAADDILSFAGKIRGLRSLLFLARSNHFVNPVNCEVLERECRFLEDFFILTSEEQNENKFSFSPSTVKTKGLKPFMKAAEAEVSENSAKASSFSLKKIKMNPVKKILQPSVSHESSPPHYKNIRRIERMKKNAAPISSEEGKNRKETIIEFLQKKDKSSIKDISDVFDNISTKTIQRDLNSLIQDGRVERSGDKRWALYYLKNE